MARKHKNTQTTGLIPKIEEIEIGEIQINLEDQVLYSKNSFGEVIPVSDLTANAGLRKIFLVNVLSVGTGSAGSIKENGEVIEASGDSDEIQLEIYALPAQNFKPEIKVNGISIPENDLNLENGYWVSRYNISGLTSEENLIQILHVEADELLEINYIRTVAPIISELVLNNFNYEGSQTAIKENQTATVKVTSDQALVSGRIISDGVEFFNLFKSGNVDLSGGETSIGSGIFEYTFTATAKNIRNQISRKCSFIFAGRNEIGSESTPYNSVFGLPNSNSAEEKINYLLSDSVLPTLSINSIDYPAGQEAIKSNEEAAINFSYVSADIFEFSSNDDTIDIPSNFSKSVNEVSIGSNGAGTYDESQNFSIKATKIKNNTSITVTTNVRIADIAPEVNKDSGFNSTFKSGGSYNSIPTQNSISVLSDQDLLAVEIDVENGKGSINTTWSSSSNKKSWTNDLICNDTDEKGTHQFINLKFTNQAGIESTLFENGDFDYEFKGFVERTFSIGPLADSANSEEIPEIFRNNGPDNNPLTGSGISDLNSFVSQIGTNISNVNDLEASWTAGGNLKYFGNLNNETSTDSSGDFLYSYTIVDGLEEPEINSVSGNNSNVFNGNCFRLTAQNKANQITTYTQVTIKEN